MLYYVTLLCTNFNESIFGTELNLVWKIKCTLREILNGYIYEVVLLVRGARKNSSLSERSSNTHLEKKFYLCMASLK